MYLLGNISPVHVIDLHSTITGLKIRGHMYAIIRSGSKQYRVKKGDVIEVDLLTAAPGEKVQFKDVLFLGQENGAAKVGKPTIPGSVVTAEFVATVKGPKIQAIKYKRRKNAYRKFGHRQKYSQVKIVDITG
jgi:large subunit ribosomal protein L21